MAKKKRSTAHLTKYQFQKGGGTAATKTKKRKHHPAVQHHTRTVYVQPKRKSHGRRKSAGGGMKLLHLAVAAGVLGYVTSSNHGVAFIKDNAAKLPGAATFGVPAAIGAVALGVDKFVKPNKWLKLIGAAGIVVAAMKVGDAGTDFKFIGEPDGSYDMDDDA